MTRRGSVGRRPGRPRRRLGPPRPVRCRDTLASMAVTTLAMLGDLEASQAAAERNLSMALAMGIVHPG